MLSTVFNEGTFAGRVLRPGSPGPSIVTIRDDGVFGVTSQERRP